MSFAGLFRGLIFTLCISPLPKTKNTPPPTPYVSLTMDAYPKMPRFSHLSHAELIHEVATVVSISLQKKNFPETISGIEEYMKLEMNSTQQGVEMEKVAGIIWDAYEREVEKLGVAEKRKRD
jgi:hypothetical protein